MSTTEIIDKHWLHRHGFTKFEINLLENLNYLNKELRNLDLTDNKGLRGCYADVNSKLLRLTLDILHSHVEYNGDNYMETQGDLKFSWNKDTTLDTVVETGYHGNSDKVVYKAEYSNGTLRTVVKTGVMEFYDTSERLVSSLDHGTTLDDNITSMFTYEEEGIVPTTEIVTDYCDREGVRVPERIYTYLFVSVKGSAGSLYTHTSTQLDLTDAPFTLNTVEKIGFVYSEEYGEGVLMAAPHDVTMAYTNKKPVSTKEHPVAVSTAAALYGKIFRDDELIQGSIAIPTPRRKKLANNSTKGN